MANAAPGIPRWDWGARSVPARHPAVRARSQAVVGRGLDDLAHVHLDAFRGPGLVLGEGRLTARGSLAPSLIPRSFAPR